MAEIKIDAFSGMNNLNGSFYARKGVASPKVVLDADVNEDGDIVKRSGSTLYMAMSGAHSLKGFDSCLLCAASGFLHEIGTGADKTIDSISGPTDKINGRLDYVLCEGKIYMSNPYWRGVLDPSTGTVSDWGIPLPPGPVLLTSTGNLPAGTYHVCLTNTDGEAISGNGAISSLQLYDTGGIQIVGRPSGSLVWATDANEPIFYLCGEVDEISGIPTVEPLMTFMCGPPPNMTCLAYAFGRIWGSVGPVMYYSEPYRPDLFCLTRNKFTFDSDITLIAIVPTGIFVGMKDRTVFLAGTDPKQMSQSPAGAGSVRGTLEYCNNVPYLADKLGTPEKVFVDVPIWRTDEGIAAGNTTGRLFNLTKDKLKMGRVSLGASLHHNISGAFKFLTSSVAGSGDTDPDTMAALMDGRLSIKDLIRKVLTSYVSASDEATCEVWRNGERIY